jgi:salicylate hydroxylase
MQVVVVGGGIGGLALALALRRSGVGCTVLERARDFDYVGAGIQLSPNATRVLGWLGVLEPLAGAMVRPGRHRFLDWRTGETLLATPLGSAVEAAFGSLYAHAHRADLLDAFRRALGDVSGVRFGVEVDRVEQDAGRAWAVCAGGERVAGDVVVGADGVRSLIREARFAPGVPRHSGCMAWRGLTPADAITDLGFERDSYIWMGPGRSVVIYYVAGGRLLNWIGIGPSDGETRESWTTPGTVEAALAEFDGWHPMVRTLIARSAPPFKWALYDREPLERWVDGRVALLGDAAHAMLPYHAQGAAQSIEDAWVLARALELGPDDPAAALRRYEDLRRPRTRQVQEASRAAERLFHLADPDAVAARNARFARAQARMGDGFPPGQEWLFAYDAERAVTGQDREWQALAWGS